MEEKNKKVANVPNLRFREFNEPWKTNNLGSLLEFKNGINASKEQYGSGIKFINVLDILKNDFITSNNIIGKVAIDETTAEKYSVKYGDILFQRSSETREEVGTANVYLDKEKIATFGGFVIRGRKIGDYDPIFLNKLLKTNSARESITSKSGGSTRYNVGQEVLSSITLYFPSLTEQNKLSSFLSLIDERIQTQIKIIKELTLLTKGMFQKIEKNGRKKDWVKTYLKDVLTERKETNKNKYAVHSVSVSKGVINQIEYLGRSFAAKDITNYNVVYSGDVIYTKSPTGDFPFGIIKQSFIESKVAVSPLYGVFIPNSYSLGTILHFYFNNPLNTKNYLGSLIQKGAKNTINITNANFLNNQIYLPSNQDEIDCVANLLLSLNEKINLEVSTLNLYNEQKKHLLQKMFI